MNRFSAFSLGVVLTAVSVGAVNYVSAAGDVVIKACANKSTGAMRYISKGSCKKSEKTLNWNQVGPQGQPGATGASGQNQWAIDKTGKTIGPVRSIQNLNCDGFCVTVEIAGRFWGLSLISNNLFSTAKVRVLYTNATCTNPIAMLWNYLTPNPQTIVIDVGDTGAWDEYDISDKAYVLTGNSYSFSGLDIYSSMDGPCLALTNIQKAEYNSLSRLFSLTEISKPNFSAPLSIVSQ